MQVAMTRASRATVAIQQAGGGLHDIGVEVCRGLTLVTCSCGSLSLSAASPEDGVRASLVHLRGRAHAVGLSF